jgi:hypothetical protein
MVDKHIDQAKHRSTRMLFKKNVVGQELCSRKMSSDKNAVQEKCCSTRTSLRKNVIGQERHFEWQSTLCVLSAAMETKMDLQL